MSLTSSSPEVEVLLVQIRDQLQKQDVEALKSSEQTLRGMTSPKGLMDLLASYLFQDDYTTNDDTSPPLLSNKDALSVLGFLVTCDASHYLKPASKAVRDEAVRLTKSEQIMSVSPELLNVMVSQLSGKDIQVSLNATEAIVACCRKLGPSSFGEPVLRAIAESWRNAWNAVGTNRTEASTIAVRCASAIVDIVCLDGSMMRLAMSCGDISLLLTMLTDESDPLLEISTLDLIERMTVTQPMHHERAQWLFSNDIVVPLLQMCGGIDDEGFADPILGAPALRVVAALCRLAHRDSSLFRLADTDITKGFYLALHNFEGKGEMDRLAIVDAISSFASASSDALDLVLADPITRQAWLSLAVAQPKLKSVILFSVSIVLDPNDEKDNNGDTVANPPPSNALGMKLFSQLGQVNNNEATNLVLSLAKSPLPETRLAAYALLKAVAKLSTGGQLLFTHQDFFEFLMRRENEYTKEGKEAKFGIVEAILSSEVKGLLAEDIVRQMEQYVKEGPHFVKTQRMELATD